MPAHVEDCWWSLSPFLVHRSNWEPGDCWRDFFEGVCLGVYTWFVKRWRIRTHALRGSCVVCMLGPSGTKTSLPSLSPNPDPVGSWEVGLLALNLRLKLFTYMCRNQFLLEQDILLHCWGSPAVCQLGNAPFVSIYMGAELWNIHKPPTFPLKGHWACWAKMLLLLLYSKLNNNKVINISSSREHVYVSIPLMG